MVSRIDLGPDGGPYVELDEDAGEFIIRVPQDNVSFDGADLNSVGTASVSALEADELSITDTIAESGSATGTTIVAFSDDIDNVSSESYTTVIDGPNVHGGFVDPNRIPDGMSLYGNFVARASSIDSDETGHYVPRGLELTFGGVSNSSLLSELEVEITDTNITSSGWQEISSLDLTADMISIRRIDGKVSGGTLSADDIWDWVLVFEWRVD